MTQSEGKIRKAARLWLFGAIVSAMGFLFFIWALLNGLRPEDRTIQIVWLPVFAAFGVIWLRNYLRLRR